jgi:CO dehydrogenase maturation factor
MLIVVVEPGRGSIETAGRIDKLAQDIGLKNIAVVGNKLHGPSEKEFITSKLKGFEFLGFIPYDQSVSQAEISNRPILSASRSIAAAVKEIYGKLVSRAGAKSKIGT